MWAKIETQNVKYQKSANKHSKHIEFEVDSSSQGEVKFEKLKPSGSFKVLKSIGNSAYEID